MKKTTLQLCRVKLQLCIKKMNAILLLALALSFSIQLNARCTSLQDSLVLSMRLLNAPLGKAFDLIKQQTPYRFIYDNSLLKKSKPVSLTVSNEPLTKVLSLLFRNQPFDYRIIEQSIIITPHAAATGIAVSGIKETVISYTDTLITGTVMADSGLVPLTGATIELKGTGLIVSTDNNGRFSIRIPEAGGILQVSYVGHSPKAIAVNSRTGFPLTILLMKKPTELDVVTLVSTGYEFLPKERITGSFTPIDNKTLNEQVGGNIIDRLKGVASSVLFDKKTNGPSFTIRGLSTINGPKEPLIILDNYPYEGDINNINPNDVENITILKDAAAASIWGTRAGNGVVVITTKKGRFNQGTRVEFNSNIIITEKPDLFYQPQMSPADHIDVEEMLFNNGFYTSQINSPTHTALSPVVEILLKQQQGSLSSADAAARLNALKTVDIRNEYNKHFYRQAFYQQHALNIRGGSEKIAYLISGGYDKGLSNLDAPNNRITLRSENSYKPTRALQVNFGILSTNSSTQSGKPGYGDILMSGNKISYLSFTDADGKPLAMAKTYRQSYTDTAGGGKLLDWNYYPLEDYKYNTSKTNLTDLIGKVGFNYKLMPGLDIDFKYQYQKQQTTSTTLAALESYYTRDLINKYTQLDYATGKVKYAIPLGGIFGKTVSTLESQNLRGQINFNRRFGQHEIVSLIGSEIRQTRQNTDNMSAFGYDPSILTTGVIDIVNPQLNFVTRSYDYLSGGGVSYAATNNRFVSFFGNASYIFKGKYILTGSARKDASNLFGKA
ncbi:MAG: TonB-dependent receptor plug domain-containing protein, partial [Ferruginibacter sp.]